MKERLKNLVITKHYYMKAKEEILINWVNYLQTVPRDCQRKNQAHCYFWIIDLTAFKKRHSPLLVQIHYFYQ